MHQSCFRAGTTRPALYWAMPGPQVQPMGWPGTARRICRAEPCQAVHSAIYNNVSTCTSSTSFQIMASWHICGSILIKCKRILRRGSKFARVLHTRKTCTLSRGKKSLSSPPESSRRELTCSHGDEHVGATHSALCCTFIYQLKECSSSSSSPAAWRGRGSG